MATAQANPSRFRPAEQFRNGQRANPIPGPPRLSCSHDLSCLRSCARDRAGFPRPGVRRRPCCGRVEAAADGHGPGRHPRRRRFRIPAGRGRPAPQDPGAPDPAGRLGPPAGAGHPCGGRLAAGGGNRHRRVPAPGSCRGRSRRHGRGRGSGEAAGHPRAGGRRRPHLLGPGLRARGGGPPAARDRNRRHPAGPRLRQRSRRARPLAVARRQDPFLRREHGGAALRPPARRRRRHLHVRGRPGPGGSDVDRSAGAPGNRGRRRRRRSHDPAAHHARSWTAASCRARRRAPCSRPPRRPAGSWAMARWSRRTCWMPTPSG